MEKNPSDYHSQWKSICVFLTQPLIELTYKYKPGYILFISSTLHIYNSYTWCYLLLNCCDQTPEKEGIIYFDSQIQIVCSIIACFNVLAENIILVGTGVRDSSSNNNKKGTKGKISTPLPISFSCGQPS